LVLLLVLFMALGGRLEAYSAATGSARVQEAGAGAGLDDGLTGRAGGRS
jgi:hypothetical protein